MVTPGWLTSVPANLGEPKHRKLKSDQWWNFGMTYLPISLIRLWDWLEDNDNNSWSQDYKKLLLVTLSLISVVIIASSCITSLEKARLYLAHIQAYLSGLHELLPQYKFLPNHHMVLHLSEYLELYGPVHAWWTFPFKLLIGLLQHIPTNFQDGKQSVSFFSHCLTNWFAGQLEETISTSFTISSNLWALLLKEGCPSVIRNCHSLFAKLVDPQICNMLLTDISHFSVDIHHLIQWILLYPRRHIPGPPKSFPGSGNSPYSQSPDILYYVMDWLILHPLGTTAIVPSWFIVHLCHLSLLKLKASFKNHQPKPYLLSNTSWGLFLATHLKSTQPFMHLFGHKIWDSL